MSSLANQHQLQALAPTNNMKAIVLAVLVAIAAADKRPLVTYGAPAEQRAVGGASSSSSVRQIAILRDDRVHPEAGAYSFDVETEDGIERHESGAADGSQQGVISFTFPDGQVFNMQFVADANGFQPQSSWLPVAPEFPHPIPQFVLDQIAFAAEEDARRAREGDRPVVSAPRQGYGAPSK